MIRRTMPELEELQARAMEIYPLIGAVFREKGQTWTFPNGARLKMRYLDRDAHAARYQGHRYTWIGVDEAGNFPSPDPIDKLYACMRSAEGVPCRMRLTGNPMGPGHAWLKARYVKPAKPMTPVYWKRIAMHRIYIPSKLEDNAILMKNDPSYFSRIAASGNDALVKAWRTGSWDDAVVGKLFNTGRVNVEDITAKQAIRRYGLRPTLYYDFATKAKDFEKKGDDPDYNACSLWAKDEMQRMWLLWAWHAQCDSGQLYREMCAHGLQWRCQQKGEAGQIEAIMSGILPLLNRASGESLVIEPLKKGAMDKVQHSWPFHMAMNSGNIYVPSDCEAWQQHGEPGWLQLECQMFPMVGKEIHDDGVDTGSYACSDLRGQLNATPPESHPAIRNGGELRADEVERMIRKRDERVASVYEDD